MKQPYGIDRTPSFRGEVPTSKKSYVFYFVLAASIAYCLFMVNNSLAPCRADLIPIEQAESLVFCNKFRSRKLAVVVPFLSFDTPRLETWLQSFDDLPPCAERCGQGQVDLLFYFNRDLTDYPEVIRNLTRGYNNARNARKCFKKLRFVSANLTDYEDFRKGLIHRGPRVMFWRAFSTLGGQYDYFFQHEPDIAALKEHWADKLVNETLGDSFWIRGTVHKKRGDRLRKSPAEYWAHRTHINGAALYNLNDERFWNGFIPMVAAIPDEGPFDFAVENFTRSEANWEYIMDYLDKFQYSDFIQNVINDSINATQLRDWFPQTYLVHGLGRTPGVCSSCKLKLEAEQAKAAQEKEDRLKAASGAAGSSGASKPSSSSSGGGSSGNNKNNGGKSNGSSQSQNKKT